MTAKCHTAGRIDKDRGCKGVTDKAKVFFYGRNQVVTGWNKSGIYKYWGIHYVSELGRSLLDPSRILPFSYLVL